jgi:hypothetical protein
MAWLRIRRRATARRDLPWPDEGGHGAWLIPAGSVSAFPAEHREALFPAGMFADLY